MKSYTQFIYNLSKPACSNCIFFDKSRCMKFGKKDIVTGKIHFLNASYARDSLCREEARYFVLRIPGEPTPEFIIKEPYKGNQGSTVF